MSKPGQPKEPYELCLESPKRKQCCRLTDEQPCSAMSMKLDRLENELYDGKYSLDGYARLLVELLPGRDHGFGVSLMPEHPTMELCGSESKILVMRARVSRGESAFHPDDNKAMVCRHGDDDDEG